MCPWLTLSHTDLGTLNPSIPVGKQRLSSATQMLSPASDPLAGLSQVPVHHIAAKGTVPGMAGAPEPAPVAVSGAILVGQCLFSSWMCQPVGPSLAPVS